MRSAGRAHHGSPAAGQPAGQNLAGLKPLVIRTVLLDCRSKASPFFAILLLAANRCLRFAKPSEYEDLEDMTVQSLFPDELETALAILSDGFVDAIVANPYAPPTCSPKLRPAVVKLQKIFREKPQLAPFMKQALKDDPAKAGLNVEYWRTRSDAFIKETNEFMQNYRVLCVTTDRASERMWKEYAKDSSGIALRITPSVEKASRFELFAPVTYREQRPPVYAKTLDFAGDTMFGDHAARTRSVMDTIIYSKTNDDKFESEYRLAIPLGEGEEDYRTLACESAPGSRQWKDGR